MQIFPFALVLLAAIAFSEAGILGLAPASTLVRTPGLDPYVVESKRIGSNFAYSTVEGHAYTGLAPVAVSYSIAPAVSYAAPYVYTHPTLLLAK